MLIVSALIALTVSVVMAPKQSVSDSEPAGVSELSEEVTLPEPLYANAAILKKEPDGHFWVRADVDGYSIKFMIDTGASTVALTYQDAKRLRLDPDNLEYKWTIRTAGGEVQGASVLLPFIRIGQVKVENVEAMVLRDGLDQSLLGMSFLGELYSYEFKRNSLIIRQ